MVRRSLISHTIRGQMFPIVINELLLKHPIQIYHQLDDNFISLSKGTFFPQILIKSQKLRYSAYAENLERVFISLIESSLLPYSD